MKKTLKIAVPIITVLILLGYFFMTPIGALRLRIISFGYPISAFTFKISEKPIYPSTKENQITYSLENPPYEKETDSQLINWVVTKHGIFYIADYHGWG